MGRAAKVYLPTDLCSEILARLPVKTVLRFRLVSKTWCSVIDHPTFTVKHLSLYKNNSEKNYVLASKAVYIHETGGPRKKYYYRVSETDDIVSSSIPKYVFVDEVFVFVEIPHHPSEYTCYGLHGLFLLYDLCIDTPTIHVQKLVLWNPSIRKSLIIPLLPANIPDYQSYLHFTLGFDPESRDYKVLGWKGPFKSDKVVIYSLNSNLWKTLTLTNLKDSIDLEVNSRVYAQGAVHWIGFTRHLRYGKTHLVSFDFVKEEIRYVRFPDEATIGRSEVARLHFALGDSVALAEISPQRTTVWVLKKNAGWSKWYESDTVRPPYTAREEYILYYSSRVHQVWLFAEKCGKLLFSNLEDKMYSYDINTREVELVRGYKNVKLFPYYESLVLHNRL